MPPKASPRPWAAPLQGGHGISEGISWGHQTPKAFAGRKFPLLFQRQISLKALQRQKGRVWPRFEKRDMKMNPLSDLPAAPGAPHIKGQPCCTASLGDTSVLWNTKITNSRRKGSGDPKTCSPLVRLTQFLVVLVFHTQKRACFQSRIINLKISTLKHLMQRLTP